MIPQVLVHGGAGRLADEHRDAVAAGVRRAAEAGLAVLERGGDAQAAAVAAVRVLEDTPETNAGRGACMNALGAFELDAAIMRARDLGFGAVAAIPDVADAVLVAQAVLNHSPHVLLVGEGARAFALAHGVGQFGREAVWTAKAEQRWREWQVTGEGSGQADTVGAIALDARGDLCAAASTGGVLGKSPGRVGDTPLIGAGIYAHPRLGAALATGTGEAIARHVACITALHGIAEGGAPEAAFASVCADILAHTGAGAGLVGLLPTGRAVIAHATPSMSWALARAGEATRVGTATGAWSG